jgi:hypothetical protein
LTVHAYPYPEGMDCVWIASDKNSNVAAFVTGGFGPIPRKVLESKCLGIEEVEGTLSTLPDFSVAQLLVSMPRPDDFIEMAGKGFFVYDWCDVERVASQYTGLYELMASPVTPIKSHMLPLLLRNLVSDVGFSMLSFSESITVKVTDAFECIDGY